MNCRKVTKLKKALKYHTAQQLQIAGKWHNSNNLNVQQLF